jgi:hypothetical protein
MNNLSIALKEALTHTLPGHHVMDLNEISTAAVDSVAHPQGVLFLHIMSVQKVAYSSAHQTKEGFVWGNAYEVQYLLAMKEGNALSSNTMTNILDMGLSGTSATAQTVRYFADNRNFFYLMTVEATCLIVFEQTPAQSTLITRVKVAINDRESITISIEKPQGE